MPFRYLLLVLRSRIWLMVLVAVTTVAAGTYFTLTQPKEYRSSASLLLNFNSENPFEERGLAPQLADSYMATQVDIITSRSVVNRVIDELGLAETAEQRAEWMGTLTRNIDVETGRESRLVHIFYQSEDPQFAADVTNAFASAYVATTRQLMVEPAVRNSAWFGEQIDRMRERLTGAQSRMTSFQQEEGIVALDDRLDNQMSRLNELSNQLVEAQNQLYDARSRQLGPNHPDYLRAVQREQALQDSLEEQKQHVLALRQQRDQLQVLAKEVGVEEEAYSRALQSYYNAQLLSSYGQTSVEILDPALPSSEPASPKVMLNIIGSVLLGLMLATLLAIGAELMFRKIREPEDIGELLDTRMLSRV